MPNSTLDNGMRDDLEQQKRAAIKNGDIVSQKRVDEALRKLDAGFNDETLSSGNTSEDSAARISQSKIDQSLRHLDPGFDDEALSPGDTGEDDYEPEFGEDANQYLQRDRAKEDNIDLGRIQQEQLDREAGISQNQDKYQAAGGEAIKPEVKPQAAAAAEGGASGPAKDIAKKQVGEVKKKAADELKKRAMKKIASTFSKTAIKAVWAAYWPWILGGLAVIIIIIALIAALYGPVSCYLGSGPCGTGTTITQAADPLKNKDWIRKVLMLTGDADVKKLLTADFVSGLETDLTAILKESPNDNVTAKVNEILANIKAFKAASSKEIGDKIIAGVKELPGLYWSLGVMPGDIKTQAPFSPTQMSSLSFNNGSHLGTPARPCNGNECPNVPGTPGRTYQQFKANTCDAIDFKIASGTEVKPVFAGKITRNSPMSGLWVEYTDPTTKSHYIATYAHMTDDALSVGTEVGLDKVIGKVGSGHLHFEFSRNNVCAVVSPAEYSSRGSTPDGQILWNKIKTVLNLK